MSDTSSSDLEIVTGVAKQEEEAISKKQTQDQEALDINKVPIYDGKPLVEIDLEEFNDKPWAKPGNDPSEWFNYGFNEESWKAYCDKQRLLRQEYSIQLQFDQKREPAIRTERRGRVYDDYRAPYRSDRDRRR